MPPESDHFGKYRLLKRIGAGGMGEVYLAKLKGPAGFEKLVVIKRLLQKRRSEKRFVDMFFSEARVTAQLNHANIVQVYEVDHFEDVPYIAMEYVRGKSLRIVLDAVRKRGSSKATLLPQLPLLAAHYVVQIFSQLCSGLDFAHDARHLSGAALGLIHRDINPHNVLLTYRGEVKLIDFGIAKSELTLEKTQAGTIKGTVIYMSPEQSIGRKLDRRSDIFAVGICLYEILTGSNPFHKDTMAASLQAIRHAQVAPLDATHPEVASFQPIINKALAKSVEDRFKNCAEMAQALQQLLLDGKIPRLEVSLANYMQHLFEVEIDEETRMLSQTERVEMLDIGPSWHPVEPAELQEEKTRAFGAAASASFEMHTLANAPDDAQAQADAIVREIDNAAANAQEMSAPAELTVAAADTRPTRNLGPGTQQSGQKLITPVNDAAAGNNQSANRDYSNEETSAHVIAPQSTKRHATQATTGMQKHLGHVLTLFRQPRVFWTQQSNGTRLTFNIVGSGLVLVLLSATFGWLTSSGAPPARQANRAGRANQAAEHIEPADQANQPDPASLHPTVAPDATAEHAVLPTNPGTSYNEEVHINALADAPGASFEDAAAGDTAVRRNAHHANAGRHRGHTDHSHAELGEGSSSASLQIAMEPEVNVSKDGVTVGRRVTLREPAGALDFGPTAAGVDAKKFAIKVRYQTHAKSITYTIESEPWANVYGAGGIALGRTPIKDMAGNSTTVLEFKNPRLPGSQRITLHFASD